jgi:hypothetical protein
MSTHSIPSIPPPSQEDAAASEQSSGDIITELQEMFAPYDAAYDETVANTILSQATGYQLAIKLVHEICERLKLAKTGSIFAKNMIQSLWSLTTTRFAQDDEDDEDEEEFDPDVNVVSLIYDFLSLCGNHPDAPFASATFGMISQRNTGKYDPNYHISFKLAKEPLDKVMFGDIFRAFRSIIGNMIKFNTGTYDIPEAAYAHEWKYSVRTGSGKGNFINKSSPDFIQFILELAPVYAQLEKFTPKLSELYDVFNKASAAAKAHRAERDTKREARNTGRDMRSMQEKHEHHRTRPAKTPVKAAVAKPVEQRPFVEAPMVACRWGVVNPITGAALPIAAAATAPIPAAPATSLPTLIEDAREVVSDAASDGEGEFQVVSSQKKRNDRSRNWRAAQCAQSAQRAPQRATQSATQASGESTPRIQRRMDRASTWREQQASKAAK